MSEKRRINDVYKTRKRICASSVSHSGLDGASSGDNITNNELPIDSKAAMMYIKNIFPIEKFNGSVPAIVLKHQLYALLKNRTRVDQELGQLRNNAVVRLFKLGAEEDEFCLVFMDDYKILVHQVAQQNANDSTRCALLERFLQVMVNVPDISVNQQTMCRQYQFNDADITGLVQSGVLTVRDVGSWWIALPNVGSFVKSFSRGRKSTLTMIRKSKYKEILQSELESRKLPKSAKLGMHYHILDLIGSDLVECIQTTSGPLLRLKD